MEKLDTQKALTIAAIGMLNAGMTSIKEDGGCAYRGDNGLCCGVGYLVPDELAYKMDNNVNSVGMKVTGIVQLITTNAIMSRVVEHFKDVDLGFLAELQRLHDGGDVSYWEEGLKNLAKEYNLKWNIQKNPEEVWDEIK